MTTNNNSQPIIPKPGKRKIPIPKKVTLDLGVSSKDRKLDEFLFDAFNDILDVSKNIYQTLFDKRIHMYIYGAPGAGKTHLAKELAMKANLDYWIVSGSPVVDETKIFGHKIDSIGKTKLYDLVTKGGVLIIDEMDAIRGEELLCINSLLATNAGDTTSYLDENVVVHKDFVCIATGNTNGRGYDVDYPNRQELDEATLDRFIMLKKEIDWQMFIDAGLILPLVHELYGKLSVRKQMTMSKLPQTMWSQL